MDGIAHLLQDFDSNLINSNSFGHYFHSSDYVYFLNNAGRSGDKFVRQFEPYFLVFAFVLISALFSTVVSVSLMIGLVFHQQSPDDLSLMNA